MLQSSSNDRRERMLGKDRDWQMKKSHKEPNHGWRTDGGVEWNGWNAPSCGRARHHDVCLADQQAIVDTATERHVAIAEQLTPDVNRSRNN